MDDDDDDGGEKEEESCRSNEALAPARSERCAPRPRPTSAPLSAVPPLWADWWRDLNDDDGKDEYDGVDEEDGENDDGGDPRDHPVRAAAGDDDDDDDEDEYDEGELDACSGTTLMLIAILSSM